MRDFSELAYKPMMPKIAEAIQSNCKMSAGDVLFAVCSLAYTEKDLG
jgi:hypothetical protein